MHETTTTRRLLIEGPHGLYWNDPLHAWVPIEIASDYALEALGVLALPPRGRWVPVWL